MVGALWWYVYRDSWVCEGYLMDWVVDENAGMRIDDQLERVWNETRYLYKSREDKNIR